MAEIDIVPESQSSAVDNNAIPTIVSRPTVLRAGDLKKETIVGFGNNFVPPAKMQSPNVLRRFTKSIFDRLDTVYSRAVIPPYVPNFARTASQAPVSLDNYSRNQETKPAGSLIVPVRVAPPPPILTVTAKSPATPSELGSIPEEDEDLCDSMNTLAAPAPLYQNRTPHSCPALYFRLDTITEEHEEEEVIN